MPKLSPPLHNTVLLMLFLPVSFIALPQNGWKKHLFVLMDIKIDVPHHLWRLAQRECLILSSHAIPPSIHLLWWEVLPRAYRLLFIPWCSWGLSALKGLASLPLLHPSLFPSLNLKCKPVGSEKKSSISTSQSPLRLGPLIYKSKERYIFQIQVVTDKSFRAWIF